MDFGAVPVLGPIFAGDAPKQPGVGGEADQSGRTRLVQDPSTGLYFDPKTGTSYADPVGTVPVTDPNLAQQVAVNFARGTDFLNKLGGVQQQQGALAGDLRSVIAGNGPSLAAMEAGAGMDQIARQVMSQTQGIGGPTAPLANLLAMRTIGNAQVGANNAAAMGRAAEGTAARGLLANLLNTQAQQDLAGGTAYSGMAGDAQGQMQGLDAATAQANKDRAVKAATAGSQAIAGALTPSATKPPGVP